jgi:hypothetical protein
MNAYSTDVMTGKWQMGILRRPSTCPLLPPFLSVQQYCTLNFCKTEYSIFVIISFTPYHVRRKLQLGLNIPIAIFLIKRKKYGEIWGTCNLQVN